MLQIALPSYGIKSYCRAVDEFNDYKILTTHESEIINKLFVPDEGDVVIDAGSHIGLFSIISAKRLGASGKVISIEADFSTYQMLEANIHLNDLNNVKVVNCILYSKDMSFSLSNYEAILSAGRRGGIAEQEREQRKQEEQIQKSAASNRLEFQNALTLDSVLENAMGSVKPVNWIKIDVEGGELDVLKGGARTLAENQNIAILIEVHRSWLYRPILDLLYKQGFELLWERIYGGEIIYGHILVSKSHLNSADLPVQN